MSDQRGEESRANKKSGGATILARRVRHNITSSKVRLPVVWWRHRGIKPADIFLGSYPRSGSTWLRFTLFEILTGKPSSFYSVNAALRGISDYKHGWPLLPGAGRFIGTHEPFRDEYRKAIYLVRDVRDVALSEFAFEKNLGIGRERMDDYLKDLLFGRKRHGSWQNHVQSWIDSPIANNGNLLLIRYEELRRDSVPVFMKMADFLDVSVSQDCVSTAIANNNVQKMREKEHHLYTQKNYSAVPRRPKKGVQPDGRFVGSGTVGSWQEKLSGEQIRLIEQNAGAILSRLGYPLASLANAEMVSSASGKVCSQLAPEASVSRR